MPRIEHPVKLLAPFVAGLAVAPFVKPFIRAATKTTIGVALHARKLAAQAREDLQDVVAEATADVVAAQNGVQRPTSAPSARIP